MYLVIIQFDICQITLHNERVVSHSTFLRNTPSIERKINISILVTLDTLMK